MSNPFEDLRALVAEVEARTASRLTTLERENDRLTKENRDLWSQVHAVEDAKTEPPSAAEEDRQG